MLLKKKITKKDIVHSATGIDFIPVDTSDIPNEYEYTKIPFSQLVSFGLPIAISSAFFSQIGIKHSETLYRAVSKDGKPVTLPYICKNGLGFSSGYMNGRDVASAHFIPVNVTHTSSPLTPITPTILFMATVLVGIENRLNDIRSSQLALLNILRDEKKSEIRGDLNFLIELLTNYKHNYCNDLYRTSMHIKVWDIKQASEQKIDYYTRQIGRKLQHDSLDTDRAVKSILNEIYEDFNNYRLAVYAYGFSSFLDILLLENFDACFLDKITSEIEDHSRHCHELYIKCYNQLATDSESTNRALWSWCAAQFCTTAGKTISKIPIIKKTPLGTFLTESGDSISKRSEEKSKLLVRDFAKLQHKDSGVFIDNINTINRLHNQPSDILLGSDAIYLRSLTE